MIKHQWRRDIMDNSNMPNTSKSKPRLPLGMNSFGQPREQTCEQAREQTHQQTHLQKSREQFGRNVRLAIGCISVSD